MKKHRYYPRLAFLLAVMTVLLFTLSGCGGVEDATDAFASNAGESQSQTGVQAEPSSGTDSPQRNYRTKMKGGGEDVVTLMVYLCGSDLESRGGAATIDLVEMISADIGDNLNIVVETGGANKWATDVMDPQLNQRWKIADNDLFLLESTEAKNMSKGSTLQDFITYSAKNFPADRYMLVLWDHGGGTVGGYAYDERFDNSAMMSISELDSALAGAGVAFDMIGFDCCLMSTVETAFMVEKYADYMVASQRVEPGNGWYYTTWIEALSRNTSIPTPELGAVIVDSFIKECKGGFAGNELTLSVTDLTYIPKLFDGLYGFFSKAQVNLLESDMFLSTSQVLNGSRAMQSNHDLVDLSYLIENMDGSQELLSQLEQCVVYNGATIENHNGLCMYVPYTDLSKVADALNICDQIGIGEPYQNFIATFANIMLGGQAYNGGGSANPLLGGDEFDLSGWLGLGWADEEQWTNLEGFFADNSYDASELVINEKGDNFVLSLPDEDWELITAANLRVFYDDGEGYTDLGSDGIYEFDDDGDLLIKFDYTWIALNGEFVCFYQEDEYVGDDYWYSYGVVPIWFEDEYAELVVVWDSDNPDGYVAGWRYTNFGGETQKGLFELWDGMYFDFVCDYYTYDGEYEDCYFFGSMTVDGPITVSYEEIDYSAAFEVYYELQDIYNNTYWTESIVYGDYEQEQEQSASNALEGFIA